ncbi:MAG: fumarate reductase subunit D [bacterium]|nr:fumarate reductase subunit D [bacterium]
MATKRMMEPFWWALFGAGGTVAALLVPIHLILHSIATPLGWVSVNTSLFGHPLVKLYLFGLISLPLYHWAHRFRYILYDLGVKGMRQPIAVLCYGTAVVGTIATLWILWRI